ncbi:YdcF family protein [Paenibacillus sp. CC-CFT747]|nr:YdcF family protein [Paenibacillus sp. CC-CFT747]
MGKPAAVLILLGVLWTGYIQWRIYHLEAKPLTGKSDVGIVLGASLWKDEPSPGLKERLDHAYRLYREGRFAVFLVSGGLDANGATITEAEGMRRYLLAKGVPEQAVLTETKSTSTYENLRFSQAIMKASGLKSSIVITHAYHGARSEDIARFLRMEPFQVSVCGSTVLNMAWHKSRETLAFTKWELQKFGMFIRS